MVVFWKRRVFIFPFVAYTISLFGTTFSQIALNLWILQTTGSAKTMAVMMISGMIIGVLFGSLGGTLADRVDRRKIMMISDLAMFILFAAIAYCMYEEFSVWSVIAINGLVAFVGVFQGPAFHAAFTDISGKENIQRASSMMTIADNLARIIGLGFGGYIVAVWGGTFAISFDALTYLFSFGLLLFAGQFPIPDGKKEDGNSFKQDYIEGLRRVWNDRLMRGIVAVFPAMFMVWSSSFMLILVLLIKVWKLKPVQYGIIETCIPIGYVIAALIIMIVDKKFKRRGRFMIGSMIITVPVYISLALLKNHAFIFPHVLLLGFLLAFSTQFLFILIRTSVESAFQGRLFGVLNTIGGIIPPIGIAVSSYFADIYGASVVLIVNAGLLFIVALLGIFVFKEIWKVN